MRNRLRTLPHGVYTARDLGPVLELARLSSAGLLPAPSKADWLALNGMEAIGDALRAGRTSWTCRVRNIGFLKLASSPPEDEAEEISFGLAAQKAAVANGFPRRLAAQLVGAFGEMRSNIYEHSGAPATGLAAYRVTAGRFEFVVSDGGIGILASLAGCPDYAGLKDHGDALRLALTEGVSRYGKAANRGMGFRPLFTGLANLNGELRFRSGNQALTIDGRSPSLIPAKQAEKPSIPGFFASVACALPARKKAKTRTDADPF
jgi:anti-sigma regulatory factor (Ser/Thr protein kinase)